jgi:hypothetical protein
MSLSVKEKIRARNGYLDNAKGITIRIRGDLMGQSAYLTLMESDGTAWSSLIDITEDWKELIIPFEKLRAGKGVLLPLGFPERWNYWVTPAQGRGGPEDNIKPEKIENVQLSIRPSGSELPEKDPLIEVSLININFE